MSDISFCLFVPRWDWVTGGRAGGSLTGSEAQGSPRNNECKLHRRKLHKKLLHQMQELEAARRGIQVALEDQHVSSKMMSRNYYENIDVFISNLYFLLSYYAFS